MINTSVIIFPRENQKCPWNPFLAVFWVFFTGGNLTFTPTFLKIFTGSPEFSRALFEYFSRVEIFISRAECREFSRHSLGFHKRKFLIFFTPTFFVFTGGICGKFHGDCWFFTGSFQEIFTGRKIFSRPEIQKFSREEKKKITGKKKKHWWTVAPL